MMKQRKKRTVSSEQLSESALNECLDLVIFDWGEGFCTSPHFLNLSENERLQSENVVGFFTDMMFNYFDLDPQEWNSYAMKECCVHFFPEKISEGPEFFQCVVPVLSAFFAYLNEQHLQKNAAAMVREIKNLHKRIVEQSSNPDHWGMAKRFVMAARSEGIDVTDSKAVRTFIEAYNQKVIRDGPASSMFYNAPYDFVIVPKGKKATRKKR
ncbi:MAG: hypothetical protein WC586_04915 [Methanoregula sp.]